ncbi:MAG TPA: FHA domain-containing protein [Stellaceae bacterium]|nr:FHA domain-containing protein [Stellaceae bacterium]
MEVEFTFLTQRGTAVMRRSQRASADSVRLGRGTDNEVPLGDIRVGLRVAQLVRRPDGIAIEKLGAMPLQVNGQSVDNAMLHVGDEIRLGPYRIEVTAPPEGCDGAIQIELAEPLASATDPVRASSRIGLEHAGFSKRIASWTGVLVLAVICLAVPLIVFTSGALTPWHKDTPAPHATTLVGLSWNTGEFSNSHRFFAKNCATCHEGKFSRVADTACLACHAAVGSHVEHGVKLGSAGEQLAESRCIDCHTEHRGVRGSVIRTAALCLDCHRGLDKTAPEAGVKAVGGYPAGHPQFRATLVADAAKKQNVRVELGSKPAPADHPGIKFSHAAHLVPGGFPKLHYKEMACADCHVPEPGGQSFQPITFKGQCQSCHNDNLTFDSVALPWSGAKVPHGDDSAVVAGVVNFYAAQAVQNGAAAPAATPAVERRGAGMPTSLASAAPASVQAWIRDKSQAALRVIFDEKRGCAYCHYGTGADGAIDTGKVMASLAADKEPLKVIAAVEMRTRFLPNAVFDHSQHRGVKCEECHASRQSQASADVLIPGIETCKTCHGAEDVHLQVKSTCITCHVFHRSELGLMHMTAEAPK